MAIEFNCPYCSALIRVPDNAGGGKGKCPKCATRLTVPKAPKTKRGPSPSQKQSAQFSSPLAEESPFALSAAPPDANGGAYAVADAGPDVVDEADSTVPIGFSEPSSRPAEDRSALATQSTDRAKSSLGKSLIRKVSRNLWLVPVVFGLVLTVGFGWYVWQLYQSEQLGGELIAETAGELELPPVLVEKWSIEQPADDLQAVLSNLEKTPVPLRSPLMEIELRGSSRGVFVQLTTGPSARFYRVDMSGDKRLAKYLDKHVTEFEKRRMATIERAATAFATDYRKVVTKEANQSSLKDFRNTLALPALVRGLGYHVVATHGRTIYPCVYEDHEGALYFLLPADVKSFEISGRPEGDGTVRFPARYEVTVSGPIKVFAVTGSKSRAKPKGKQGPVFKRSDEPAEKTDSPDEATMK